LVAIRNTWRASERPSSVHARSPGEWLQRLGHLSRLLEPTGRVLGHHPGDQRRQLGGHLGAQLAERARLQRAMGLEDVPEVPIRVRGMAAQQEIERAAQAVDVGPDVGLLGVDDLFGRDEIGRAEHVACASEMRAEVHRKGRRADRRLARVLLACRLREAEVKDLDHGPVPMARQHQVRRLDVAMDHPLFVRVLQRQRRRMDVDAGVADGYRPLGLDHAAQVQPLHVLHGEYETAAAPERGIGADDVGVPQASDGADLPQKALERAGLLDDSRADDLEDLVARQEAVAREIDDPQCRRRRARGRSHNRGDRPARGMRSRRADGAPEWHGWPRRPFT
jgi:hypothetical protein